MKGSAGVWATMAICTFWIAFSFLAFSAGASAEDKFSSFIDALFHDDQYQQSMDTYAIYLGGKQSDKKDSPPAQKPACCAHGPKPTPGSSTQSTSKPPYKPVPTRMTDKSTESTPWYERSTSTSKPTYKPVPTQSTKEYERPTSTSKPTYKPVPTRTTYSESTSEGTRPATKPTYKPIPPTEATSTGRPATVEPTSKPHDCEEHDHPIRVGSIPGIPGVNFPDYHEIPITSFTCSDKEYIPGFYADMETGCQVFHVCWPHRRESFLCPIGTIFNQAILACDYWYSSNCSLAENYYDANSQSRKEQLGDFSDTGILDFHDIISVWGIPEAASKSPKEPSYTAATPVSSEKPTDEDLSFISKFLPVKARVVVYPETDVMKSKIVAEASVGKRPRTKVVQQNEVVEEESGSWISSTAGAMYYTTPHPEVVYSEEYPPLPLETEIAGKKPKSVLKVDPHDVTLIVKKIVDDVFDIARRIVQQVEVVVPEVKDTEVKTVKRPLPPVVPVVERPVRRVVLKKLVPLPTLNPRFIVKPVTLSKDEKPCSPSIKGCKTVGSTEKPRVTLKPQYKPVYTRVHYKSPGLKTLKYKQVADHYLGLLKQKLSL